MRPETSGFLDKAREFLLKAEDMFADDWPDEAGRAAYLAGLHAAQAVIVERTGRIIKQAASRCAQRAVAAAERRAAV